VALGGSRAAGTARPDSDWDLGVYYRGTRRTLDPRDVSRLAYEGTVSEIGAWGPIVNGGGWLIVGDLHVDVLYRDLDVIEAWAADARCGRFEVLQQNGYLAGAPTYLPMGELARCRVLSGTLPRPDFPHALATAAERRWVGQAAVALMFAAGHASLGDAVCCPGMLASAALATAHARFAARREWVLNEKGLVERAALTAVQPLLARPGATPAELATTVAAVADVLGVAPHVPREP
jgi:hypothetical protein